MLASKSRRRRLDEQKMNENKQRISVELSPEQSEGVYANGVGINHTPSEFILDFVRFLPGAQKAKVFSRIIMTPQNACLLRNALEDNIKKYEDRFGKIKIFGKEHKEIGFTQGEDHQAIFVLVRVVEKLDL